MMANLTHVAARSHKPNQPQGAIYTTYNLRKFNATYQQMQRSPIMSWQTLTGLCLARMPNSSAVYEATMESSMCRPAWYRAMGWTWDMEL